MQTDYDVIEVDIDAANYHTLAARMDDLHKRAVKLGVIPPELEVLGSYERITGPEDNRTVEKRYTVRVSGGFPYLSGWHFVATIEPSESTQGGNMLYAVPGETVPEQYRAATMDCDHCGTNRYRKQTFIVRHDDGRYAQVGRNCLADFIGSSVTPAVLASQAEFGALFREMVTDPDEYFGGGGSQEWHVDLLRFVTTVAATARTYGFITSKMAREANERGESHGTPTGRQAFIFETDARAMKAARDHDGFTIEDRDIELAKSAVFWGSQQEGDSDFAYNMRQVATSDAITWKQAGIAAYLVEGYRRDLERVAKSNAVKVEGATSEWLGEVGDRVHFAGKVTYTRELDGDYGVSVLVKLVDDKGNVAATFTSGRWAEELEVGEGLAIVGTIKKLDEYQGEKQTMLTRVKVQ